MLTKLTYFVEIQISIDCVTMSGLIRQFSDTASKKKSLMKKKLSSRSNSYQSFTDDHVQLEDHLIFEEKTSPEKDVGPLPTHAGPKLSFDRRQSDVGVRQNSSYRNESPSAQSLDVSRGGRGAVQTATLIDFGEEGKPRFLSSRTESSPGLLTQKPTSPPQRIQREHSDLGRRMAFKSASEIPVSPRYNDNAYVSPNRIPSGGGCSLFSHITLTKKSGSSISPNSAVFGLAIECIDCCFYVAFVLRDSPAAKANIRVGDEILRVDRYDLSRGALRSAEDVMNLLNDQDVKTRLLHIRKRSLIRMKTLTKRNHYEPLGLVLVNGEVVKIVADSAAHRACFPVDVCLIELNGENVVGLSDQALLDKISSFIPSHSDSPVDFRMAFMHRDYVNTLFSKFTTSFLEREMDRSVNGDYHVRL